MLGACLLAVVEYLKGEETDPADRQAFAIVAGESLNAVRERARKGW